MRHILLSLLLLLMSVPAYGANIYIDDSADGAGTGADWTNAYTDFPLVSTYFRPTRGDTTFVADGSYTNQVLMDNSRFYGSLPAFVVIMKATPACHGTATGWDDTLGDGQAVWADPTTYGAFRITSGDSIKIDGAVGSGTTGHGFKISIADDSTTTQRGIEALGHGIYLSHIEVDGPGVNLGAIRKDGFVIKNGSTGNHVSYCYIHDFNSTCLQWNVKQSVIEHCYLWDVSSNSGSVHSEAISLSGQDGQQYNILRYNNVKNVKGTAYFSIHNAECSQAWVYGNIFWCDNAYNIGDGIIYGNSVNDSMYIYNNTFYNLNGNNNGIRFADGTGNEAYNNVWWGCSATPGFYNVDSHDYNAADFDLSETHDVLLTVDPFVDATNQDWTPTETAQILAVATGTFTDMNAVEGDDIGAIMYAESGIPVDEFTVYKDSTGTKILPDISTLNDSLTSDSTRVHFQPDVGEYTGMVEVDNDAVSIDAVAGGTTSPVLNAIEGGASTPTDTSIVAYDSGNSYANESTTYATARDGAGLNGTTTALIVGQYWTDPNYRVRRTQVFFDLSGIPETATATACTLFMTGSGDASTTDFSIDILSALASGKTQELTDHIYFDGRVIGGSHTGTKLNDAWNTATNYHAGADSFFFNASGLDSLEYSFGDSAAFAVISDEDYGNSAPTANEYVTFDSHSDTGTEPYLSITYTTSTETTNDYNLDITGDNVTVTGLVLRNAGIAAIRDSQETSQISYTVVDSTGMAGADSSYWNHCTFLCDSIPAGTYINCLFISTSDFNANAEVTYSAGYDCNVPSDATNDTLAADPNLDADYVPQDYIPYNDGGTYFGAKAPATSLELTAMNDGGSVTVGDTLYITTVSTGVDSIELVLSIGGVETVQDTSLTGVFKWIVPDDSTEVAKLIVHDLVSGIKDSSDVVFEIVRPVLTLNGPLAGSVYLASNLLEIQYEFYDVTNVGIEWSPDDGASWVTLVSSEPATGGHDWTLPTDPDSMTTTAKIRIFDADFPDIADTTDAWTLRSKIAISAPDSGEVWTVGDTDSIIFQQWGVASLEIVLSVAGVETAQDTLTPPVSPYEWTVPNSPTTEAKIILKNLNDAASADSSAYVFTIQAAATETDVMNQRIKQTIDKIIDKRIHR